MAAKRIVFLVLPDAQLLDLAGPADVFAAANACAERAGPGDAGPARDAPAACYELVFAGPRPEVKTATGVTLHVQRLEEVGSEIDTLVVPGGIAFAGRHFDSQTLRWLRERATSTRRVASVCTGAFALAQAGLLDGRRATTHWTALDSLREAVPSARVEDDPLYVKDGAIYTSAGISAGIDLAVALVEEDHGHRLALEVAKTLVMFLHRPGGQSQFSAALHAPSPNHPGVRRIQADIAEHPGADHRVPELARRAAMSLRHFVRVFTQETGEAPARYVQRIRVERARQMLERGVGSIEDVASECGFGSPETLRRRFQQAVGVPPSEYRARFGAEAARPRSLS